MISSAQTASVGGVASTQPARSGLLRTNLLICCGLALVTLALYSPVAHYQFVNFDDKYYVTENPHLQDGVTLQTVIWAFSHSWSGNWHPVTWISHMADIHFWGLNPKAHHLTNVAFHTANAVLLFLVLLGMTGARWCSALVAGLFAWHPLHVESVAWVSERKDVLSAFFWLLTMAAYLAYVRRARWPRYPLVLVCFSLGLMAKPMVVTLPFALLLLDFWPLRRLEAVRWRLLWPLVREKIPMFLLAAAASATTFLVQEHAGAVWSLEKAGLSLRLPNALVSYAAYLRKMFWPVDLAVFYPFRPDLSTAVITWAAVLLVCLTVLAVVVARRHRYVPVGWFWYLGTLVPVIGLVQTGGQAMADRYTYLPLIGLFLSGAWAIRPPSGCHWLWRLLAPLCASGALVGCLVGTARQLSYWKDNETLFERALAVTPDSALAHANLADSLRDKGDLEGAAKHLAEATTIWPNSKQVRYSLASVLLLQNHVPEAIAQLEEILRLDPNYAIAHNNLAEAFMRQGKVESAIDHCETALRLAPKLAEAQNNLAWIRATNPDANYRNGTQALLLAELAVTETGRKRADMLDTLAAALAETGRFEEAVQAAEQAHALAVSSKQTQVAAAIAEHIELFRHGQPLRAAK